MRFPKELIWLGGKYLYINIKNYVVVDKIVVINLNIIYFILGSPGAGKGTNTNFIMKTRGINQFFVCRFFVCVRRERKV
jgi:hypothetical protein